MSAGIALVVNADDYGYFDCVSRGILAAHAAGSVGATGVMANGPRFETTAARLRATPALDAGVHLTLSWGEPLTRALAARLAEGRLPGKFAALTAILTGRWPLAEVEAEWDAQIARVADAGLNPVFINSHEHVHMLPALYRVAARLARRHGIRWLRRTTPEWQGAQGLIRNLLLGAMAAATRADSPQPRLLGLAGSGRLGPAELRRALSGLARGGRYELMCHPGEFDAAEVRDGRLLAYHDWSRELAALTDPGFRDHCAQAGIRLVSFRALAAE
ncbi:carbohydrate deacetylase [Plasticicumulans sp.]|uniref:carbohydrate deacetylase n=1 Tax=Plasticicumulans sp. TaxID=2307179 RepID=UPI0039379B41